MIGETARAGMYVIGAVLLGCGAVGLIIFAFPAFFPKRRK
jgi:hypothetical protein